MADEQTTDTATEKKYSIRKQRQLDRMAKVAKARQLPRVRVSPRDDEMRVIIKHPRAGAFRSTGDSEWPMDTFTRRRLREGSIKLEASREGLDRAGEAPRSGRATRNVAPQTSDFTS